jgi:alpha-tubulin suppressor-like RCC1 family protein
MRTRRHVFAAIAACMLVGGLPTVAVVSRAAPAGAIGAPSISIGSSTIFEGNSKTRVVSLPVTLSVPSTSTPVSVSYQIVGDTATGGRRTNPGSDFNDLNDAVRTLSFNPGQIVKYVNVQIFPDVTSEDDELLHVTLSAPSPEYVLGDGVGHITIKDDEALPTARLDVSDVSISEGDATKRNAKFTVSLSEPSTTQVTVDVKVVPDSATGNFRYGTPPAGVDLKDNLGLTKTLVFKPSVASGLTPVSKSFSVTVFADTDNESDDYFYVELQSPSPNAVLGRAAGVGAITNDDGTPPPLAWAQVSTSTISSCGITLDGAAYCWGRNNFGQLGDGTNTYSSRPNPIPALATGVTQIAAGPQDSGCAVKNHQLYCWGLNIAGQLGDGTELMRLTPTLVPGLPSIEQVSTGYHYTCALATAGTVYCWGGNLAGRLGNGTTASSLTPVAVSGLSGAVQLSTGDAHACATTASGTSYCWGSNSAGNFGVGNQVDSLTPVATPLDEGVTHVEAGGSFTCWLTNSAAVYCSGINIYGVLGDGTTVLKTIPVLVIASGVTSLSSSGWHTCALAGGAPLCWGHNPSGELGNGTTVDSHVPGPVTGLTSDVIQIDGGLGVTCAVTSSWDAYCWGVNFDGQLGDGTTIDSTVPVQVVDP